MQITEQEKQAKEALNVELSKMLLEIKRKLKGESKNELIRIIGALLLDNYTLKMQLHAVTSAEQAPAGETNETV